MRKLFFLILFFSIPAFAQESPKPKAADNPVAPAAEKPKPVILDKAKLLELENLSLKLQNAQLKAEAAIPADIKAEMKSADDAIGKFWEAIGIKRDDLRAYTVSDGVDGSKILTKTKSEAKPSPPSK